MRHALWVLVVLLVVLTPVLYVYTWPTLAYVTMAASVPVAYLAGEVSNR